MRWTRKPECETCAHIRVSTEWDTWGAAMRWAQCDGGLCFFARNCRKFHAFRCHWRYERQDGWLQLEWLQARAEDAAECGRQA